MNSFRTEIEIKSIEAKIDYHSSILLMGSCFSENIFQKFDFYKFNSLYNPFGIIFNPVSILESIERITEKKYYQEHELVYVNDSWVSLDHHGAFSGSDKVHVIKNINENMDKWHISIAKATHIFITLGTAWVYEHKEKNKIVANCHKIPSAEFSKRLLSVKETFEAIQRMSYLLQSANKKVQLVFTISPIRHLRDGFTENQTSKSILFVALQEFLKENESIKYFPAYEILMDDLRDYRFYSNDMIHPTVLAIDYVWEKLTHSYIDKACVEIMKEISGLKKAMGHRILNLDSIQSQSFFKNQLHNIEILQQKYPFLSFKEEGMYILSKINS